MHPRRQLGLGLVFIAALLLLGACKGDVELSMADLPTLMVLPTLTATPMRTPLRAALVPPTREFRNALPPTWTPTPVTPTLIPTATLVPVDTLPPPTATHTVTLVPTITLTPRFTPSYTNTVPPTVPPTPTPMGDAFVIGENGVNMRNGPSMTFNPPLALLPPLTEMILVGRSSDSRWYEARTFDGLSGWVSSNLVQTRIDPAALAITWVIQVTAAPAPPVALPPAAPVGSSVNVPIPPTGATANVPGLTISQRTRQIFQSGQSLGNRANVFSKVGDSITATQPFLIGFGVGTSDYNLGPYGYLQETINYFSASPRPGVANSFVNQSMAASSAFNAAAVLASIWADTTNCLPNESPLLCEYRINRPSVAIIMLGSVDVQIYDLNQFRASMDTIVQTTTAQGIIPVLTTFPTPPDYFPDKAGPFNDVIREIAAREQIPLIDLRVATEPLPHYGVGTDNYHLSHRGDGYIDFNGEENQWGLTLRNLLTLHTLDALRREVLTR